MNKSTSDPTAILSGNNTRNKKYINTDPVEKQDIILKVIRTESIIKHPIFTIPYLCNPTIIRTNDTNVISPKM